MGDTGKKWKLTRRRSRLWMESCTCSTIVCSTTHYLNGTSRNGSQNSKPIRIGKPSTNSITLTLSKLVMNLLSAPCFQILSQLKDTIEQISPEDLSRPLATLSGSTIGQHFRHTLEIFLCLEKGSKRVSSTTINALTTNALRQISPCDLFHKKHSGFYRGRATGQSAATRGMLWTPLREYAQSLPVTIASSRTTLSMPYTIWQL